jgi:hypothetical protein
MRGVGYASRDNLLERVDALAIGTGGVHEMHSAKLGLALFEASILAVFLPAMGDAYSAV